jgi:hypothetical protein
MKIYFSASIKSMNDHYRDRYRMIVEGLTDLGHKVISKHILEKNADYLKNQTDVESLEMQRKMTKWKKQADLSVFEVSNPSFGIGQEVAMALAASKPVICLYEEGKEPHLLRDEAGDMLLILAYTESTLRRVLQDGIEFASLQQDTRFNFFISSEIVSFLDWVSKKQRVPRAVYLRKLIEEDIKRNKEYAG